MTEQQFLAFYELNRTSIYFYIKKFPEFKVNDEFQYQLLHEEIQKRNQLREEIQNLMIDKSPIVIKQFFNNENSSYEFIARLYMNSEKTLIRNSTYKKMQEIKQYLIGV